MDRKLPDAPTKLTLDQLYALGNEAYQVDDDIDRAIEIFRQVRDGDPEWEKPRAKLGGLLLYRGRGRLAAGDIAEAVTDLREAFGTHPGTPKLRMWLQRGFRELVRHEISQCQWEDAAGTLSEWIKLGKEHQLAYELKGFLEKGSDRARQSLGRAFHLLDQGDVVAGTNELRRVIELEPQAEFVRRELADRMFELALSATEAEESSARLQYLEGAQTYVSDDAKVRTHLTAEYKAHIREALSRRETLLAEDLLARGLEISPKEPEFLRWSEALRNLPKDPFDAYCDPIFDSEGRRLPDLLLIETGADPALLDLYLEAFDESRVFSESRYPSESDIKTLGEFQSVGGAQDRAYALQASELSRPVIAAIVDAARGDWLVRHHDLLAYAEYEVEDLVFAALREIGALHEIAQPSCYGRVVIIGGNGGLIRSAKPLLEERFGEDRCHVLWCSRVLNRYEARALPGLVAASVKAPSLLGELNLALRRWWGRKRIRKRSAGGIGRIQPDQLPSVLMLPSPSPLHVSNVARIARHLVTSFLVVTLLTAKRKKKVYEPLSRLEEELGEGFMMESLELSKSAVHWAGHGEASASAIVATLDRDPMVTDMTSESLHLWPLLRPKLEHMITIRLPKLVAFAGALEARIENFRPSAMVVSPDRSTEARIACALARESGVVSFFPQAVFESDSPRYKPLQADYAFVIDRFSKELYVNHFGADPSRVIVTGSARLDPASHIAVRSTNRRRSVGTRRVLLVLQRYSVSYTQTLVGTVADAVSPLSDVKLIVRMHPGDAPGNRQHYEAVLTERIDPSRATVSNASELYEEILQSDLVVSAFSNVVLEAALLSRPVLCVNLTGQPLPVPFVEEGLAQGAESREEVVESIRLLLTDADALSNAMARQSLYFSVNKHLRSGMAATRIASLIHETSHQVFTGFHEE